MKYKIAIIVTWFGALPKYFQAWMESAEHNETIDFLIFSDQEINSHAKNINVFKTTMQDEFQRYSKKIDQPISINNAYKFCDCRLFFGLFYEEFLTGYDFWGYCDIDLMFGDIRKFVTDDVLDNYERIYQYGHLSLYKNNEKMKNLYKLQGGIYSLQEILCSKAKTTPEEYYGANRICIKNNIKWYTKIDFADLFIWYPERLEACHGKQNATHQMFVWDNGKVYRVYEENETIKKEELVYIHWQKRKPVLQKAEKETGEDGIYIICADKIITEFAGNITREKMDEYNPPISVKERKNQQSIYKKKMLRDFLMDDMKTKSIKMRQMLYRLSDKMTGARTYK